MVCRFPFTFAARLSGTIYYRYKMAVFRVFQNSGKLPSAPKFVTLLIETSNAFKGGVMLMQNLLFSHEIPPIFSAFVTISRISSIWSIILYLFDSISISTIFHVYCLIIFFLCRSFIGCVSFGQRHIYAGIFAVACSQIRVWREVSKGMRSGLQAGNVSYSP